MAYRIWRGAILLVGLAANPPVVLAQRDIYLEDRAKSQDYSAVPGVKKGSLVVSQITYLKNNEESFKLFYSDNGKSNFRPATLQDYFRANVSFRFPYAHYDVLRDGRLIFAMDNSLYLHGRGGFNAQRLGTVPKVELPGQNNISRFQFVNEKVGFVWFDESLDVSRTDDGGKTWKKAGNLRTKYEGYRGYLMNVHFISEQVGFAVVEVHQAEPYTEALANDFVKTSLVRSEDGGKSWARVQMPAEFSTLGAAPTVHYVSEGQRISMFRRIDKKIYRSTDGGKSFLSYPIPDMVKWGKQPKNQLPQQAVDSVSYKPFRVIKFNL